jgi:polyisoprenoid-binding protein YceI
MTWQIDAAHSSVDFSVRHMMISTVRGSFGTFTGTVDLNEADPSKSSVEVQIDAASIDTREEKRDGHLRSADFFDVEHYPSITFKSTRVEPINSERGRIVGNLTIKDVTREVVLEAEYTGRAKSPWGTTSAGFEAHTRISRKEWGLNWNVALETGGWLVSDEIKISIELEVVQQPEQAEELAEAEAAAAE